MKKTVSVAPMMDCTDRHDRYFLRLISKNVKLYTEMIVANAIIKGDRDFLLNFNLLEKPLVLQIGGSVPKELAEAVRIAENFGYDEINLNLGCPSKKVQKNKFGACLMKEPNIVADCLNEMQFSTRLPVTVKTRIGYDDIEDYESFLNEIKLVWEHVFRVLVPGGRLVCVVGDVCVSRRRFGRHLVFPLHADICVQCRKIGFDNLNPIIWHKIANASYEVTNGSKFLGKPYEPNAIIKNDMEFILMQRKPGGYRKPTERQRQESMIDKKNFDRWFQ